MIQQQHQETKKGYLIPRAQGVPTESLTIPGQAINLKYCMQQYLRGSLIDRAVGFYEKEGMTSPDFSKMDRVDKLAALGEYRKEVKRLQNIITNDVKIKENVLVQKENAKQQKPERPTSTTDRTDSPNAK